LSPPGPRPATLRRRRYFDRDGDAKITAEEFKQGLASLDPVRFKMSDEEITSLVTDFDKDKDGTVDMSEFKGYCLNLPGHAWKAERLRQSRASRNSTTTTPWGKPEAAAPAAAPEVAAPAEVVSA